MKYLCCLSIAIAILAAPTLALEVPSGQDGQDKNFIDTSHPGWIWNGMDAYNDTQLSGGNGRAGGPGSYGAYTFNATGVSVYVMRGPAVDVDGRVHKMGRLKVLIDGSLKASVPLSASDSEYGYRAYASDPLPAGNHVLQLQPDAGWAVIDGIRLEGGVDAAPDGSADPHGSTGKAIEGPASNDSILFSSRNVPLSSDNTVVFRQDVGGFLQGIGPECVLANLPGDWGPEHIYAHSGNTAIRYSGSSFGDAAYCAMFAYRANIPVSKSTVLTYWILPQQDNGRYVAVDLHCTDGTTLSSTAAVDQNNVSMRADAGHGGAIPFYQWSPVQCRIGDTLAGKTVDAIWIAYARNGSPQPAQYRGYIDDIVIYNQ